MTMNYLDLSKRKFELERIFGSVINKIPDLCHPPIVRLENECDFFNQTKDLKLEPFRKQEIFESCVSPTQDDRRHEAVSSPTGEFLDVTRPLSINSTTCSPSPKPVAAPVGRHQGDLRANSSSSKDRKSVNGRESAQRQRALERYRQKVDLSRKYSHFKLRKVMSSSGLEADEDMDKIFVDSLAQMGGSSSSYPFANPIPECMLTRANIDNLRDVIVSSVNIEWRMLTPIRPASEYEENYFDRLVQLHRNRFKYRQEAGSMSGRASSPTTPFKHTRHGLMVPGPSQPSALNSRHKQQAGHQNCLSFGAKLTSHLVAQRAKSVAKPRSAGRMKIPTLMLTTDDETASEPLKTKENEDEEEDDDEEGGAGERSRYGGGSGDELSEFSYEHFSRFSRRNMQFARDELAKGASEMVTLGSPDQTKRQRSPDNQQGGAILDGQIEDILSGLLQANI